MDNAGIYGCVRVIRHPPHLRRTMPAPYGPWTIHGSSILAGVRVPDANGNASANAVAAQTMTIHEVARRAASALAGSDAAADRT
jgi:hypothetical protein